jgi:hypothetical protein
MLGRIAFALAAAQIAPPTGVNGAIIGTADEFKVEGPARVCFVYGRVDIVAGEISYLDYMGIHYGAVTIVGPHGSYKVSEGENWAPTGSGNPVAGVGTMKIRRFGRGAKMRYGIYGRTDFSPASDRLLIWVDGLEGKPGDRGILRRIATTLPAISGCTRRFRYGWFIDEETDAK